MPRLRFITMPIQSQGIITQDNVSVDVSPVAYYRVVDSAKSVVAIENVAAAISIFEKFLTCPPWTGASKLPWWS